MVAGDMPIVLGPDGPSLGGFVCPATITTTQLWKMGQVRPGDSVRFKKQTIEEVGSPELQHHIETCLQQDFPSFLFVLS